MSVVRIGLKFPRPLEPVDLETVAQELAQTLGDIDRDPLGLLGEVPEAEELALLAPSVLRSLRRLEAQHERLLERMRDTIELAEQAGPGSAVNRDRVLRTVNALIRIEGAIDQLLTMAYWVDLGEGD